MLERLNFEMEEQALAAAVVVRGRQVFFACWHGEAPAGGPSWRPLEMDAASCVVWSACIFLNGRSRIAQNHLRMR